MRMQEMTKGENRTVSSRWLAAVYLLSAHAALWQKTLGAVSPGQIDFSKIRLRDSTVQDYVLYRVAKGICSGMLGAASEELADPELVSGGHSDREGGTMVNTSMVTHEVGNHAEPLGIKML